MSHSSTARAGGRSRSLILTAMIFAVASYPTRTQAPTSTPPGAKPGRIR